MKCPQCSDEMQSNGLMAWCVRPDGIHSNAHVYNLIQPDQKLPEGKTCGDCQNYRSCKLLFQCPPDNTLCDWSPSRFTADASHLLPKDEKRIALGVALGWSEPSRNTLSGRLAGLNPEVGCIDVWPEFCAVCEKLLEYHGDCDEHPTANTPDCGWNIERSLTYASEEKNRAHIPG